MRFRSVFPLPLPPQSLLTIPLIVVTAAGVQSTINNPASTGAAIEKKYVLGGSVTWGAVVAMAGAAVGAGLTL